MASKKFNFDKPLDGAMAGFVAPHAAKLVGPQLGPGVAYIAVGHYRKNDTLQTLGGISIGNTLTSGSPLASEGGYL